MARIGCKMFASPGLLTRIFDRNHLVSNTCGHFRFTPLSTYTKGEGRFSDEDEGKRLRGYRAMAPERVTIPELGLFNVLIHGNVGADMLITHRVDVPVACLSRGDHDVKRSHAIMAQNPDLKQASYVVYDSHKLVLALTNVLAQPEWFYDIGETGKSGMVGRQVLYEDRMTMETLDNQSGRDLQTDDVTRMIWTKPALFHHEEEYRLALFATKAARAENQLLTGSIIVEQSRVIAEAIVNFGDVPDP